MLFPASTNTPLSLSSPNIRLEESAFRIISPSLLSAEESSINVIPPGERISRLPAASIEAPVLFEKTPVSMISVRPSILGSAKRRKGWRPVSGSWVVKSTPERSLATFIKSPAVINMLFPAKISASCSVRTFLLPASISVEPYMEPKREDSLNVAVPAVPLSSSLRLPAASTEPPCKRYLFHSGSVKGTLVSSTSSPTSFTKTPLRLIVIRDPE